MQENDFERSIKELMDELHLEPSASVWEKVSRGIIKKGSKKWPVIFLFLIGFAVAGYFLLHTPMNLSQTSASSNDNSMNNNSSVSEKHDSLITDNSNSARNSNDQNDSNTFSLSHATVNNQTLTSHQHELIKKEITWPENYDHENLTSQKENENRVKIIPGEEETNTVFNDNNDSMVNKDIAKTTGISQTNDAATANDLTVPDSVQIVQNASTSDSLNQVTKTKPGVVTEKKKWQFGVTGFYGKSNATEGLLDFNKSYSAVTSPGTVLGNGDTIYSTSNIFSSSSSYYFGGFIKRKISDHSFISAGINFVHLSSKSAVSEKIDSAILIETSNGTSNFFVKSYYYPAPSYSAQQSVSKTYTNAYNYIELPVYFQHEFLNRKKISFTYNAGISLRKLVSSESLIYQHDKSIYFSNNDLLRKTQFQLSTALDFNFKAGNTSLFIGPQFNYSLSNLYKTSNNGNFHFINYGLRAGISLGKKVK